MSCLTTVYVYMEEKKIRIGSIANRIGCSFAVYPLLDFYRHFSVYGIPHNMLFSKIWSGKVVKNYEIKRFA